MTRRLLSVPEAAAYIGHSAGTIRNQISRGELPFRYIKSGRKVLIDQKELDKWIERLPRFGGREK